MPPTNWHVGPLRTQAITDPTIAMILLPRWGHTLDPRRNKKNMDRSILNATSLLQHKVRSIAKSFHELPL